MVGSLQVWPPLIGWSVVGPRGWTDSRSRWRRLPPENCVRYGVGQSALCLHGRAGGTWHALGRQPLLLPGQTPPTALQKINTVGDGTGRESAMHRSLVERLFTSSPSS